MSIIQYELNRISKNYPLISKIEDVNGIFGTDTEEAVKTFQQVFNLNQTGIIDSATWYRIKYIFNAVKGLGDISSEGISP
ncbi:hypothetical protein SDC9_210795 [bioreactor metagenome]|uniref:Peptidoglycan binding-like domain-containing protein n=1 Tax=bioreactor metagenome TaxID=1076179 RepID=A0A645JHF0_9ZZZZ